MKQPQVRYKRHRSTAAHEPQSKKYSVREERQLDDALEQTFPASDPVALTMPHDTSRGGADPTKKH